MTQQYCLRWNNHQPNFISVFSSLLNNESLVDVTLAAEGRHLQAHKVVLSACSSYFQSLFTVNPCQHPIVILKDVKFLDLKVIVDFMYYGEVNVSQEQLPHILKTAEMLKIKGLADIPVDQSTLTKSQSSSVERPELLTPGETNWNSDDVQRQSLSPSPCPLSPASKRKRLRKTSTGSGSGSVEKASEEHLTSEVTLTSPGGTNMGGSVIKSDPAGFQNENNTLIRKQHSNESELQRGNSNETVESESSHQITPQVPQQEASTHVDTNPTIDIAGPSTTTHQTTTGAIGQYMPKFFNKKKEGKPLDTFFAYFTDYLNVKWGRCKLCLLHGKVINVKMTSSNTKGIHMHLKKLHIKEYFEVNPQKVLLEEVYSKPRFLPWHTSIKIEQTNRTSSSDESSLSLTKGQTQQIVMGTKRGRFLMRQPRIKRESDPSHNSDSDPLSIQYLSVPPLRVERQCSDPLPSISPPPGNLLLVPGGNTLVKQHSHPLLPSELQQSVQIQQASSLHLQVMPSSVSQGESERSISPIVVVSDPLGTSQEVTPLRTDGTTQSATATLRVRTDELKRSSSSPQTSTRLSHCPVVRPGPALGCNYCWNTVDNHGRILRRKTKYHCPECQTNLCIVPCFQEYHERHVTTGQTDPLSLTSSVMRTMMFPKTSSM